MFNSNQEDDYQKIGVSGGGTVNKSKRSVLEGLLNSCGHENDDFDAGFDQF